MKKTLGTMVAIMVVAILTGTFITSKNAIAGETAKDGRFIAYDDGTVSDTRTGLMWAAKDNGSDINWANAKSYCENYRGGGYTDWRMPTQDELAGLYDAGKSRPAACTSYTIHVATELIDITCYVPWASEMRGPAAARFSFLDGVRYWGMKSIKDTGTIALPVRSGKFTTPEKTTPTKEASGISPRTSEPSSKKNLLTLDSWSYSVTSGHGIYSNSDAYQITLNLKNGFDKGIKLLDAGVRFCDLLDTFMYGVKLDPDLHLPALQVTENTGVYLTNPFMREHQRMKAMNKSDINATFYVRKIVFDDNTILKFSE